jgi:hypothetical protein
MRCVCGGGNFVATLFLLSVLRVGGHKVRKDKRAFSLDKGTAELFVHNNEAPRELKDHRALTTKIQAVVV